MSAETTLIDVISPEGFNETLTINTKAYQFYVDTMGHENLGQLLSNYAKGNYVNLNSIANIIYRHYRKNRAVNNPNHNHTH